MKKWITMLGALLVLQAALAAGLFVNRDRFGAFVPDAKLLAFAAGEVDSLRIEDGEGKSLVLRKEGGAWILPGLEGFPAAGDAVQRLLEKLEGLDRGWPVTTTSGAAARFKVADGEFERKLTLGRGDETLAMLLVGTSPGLRKVHARIPGEDPVYAVELNAYEMEADSEDWTDKSVLELRAEEITGVVLPDLTLVRQGEELVPDGLSAGEEAVGEEVAGTVDRIAGLKIRSVLGRERKAGYRQEEPALRCTVRLASGESREYVFSRPEGESYYVLKVSDRDEFFSVETRVVDRIKEADRAKLVREKAGSDLS